MTKKGDRGGFSLRDGYDSDSGLSYGSRPPRFASPSPSMSGSYTTESVGAFVFDKNVSLIFTRFASRLVADQALKGRGAKMFDRQSKRMDRYTKEHNDTYAQFKGKQTKGESGGHGQV